jgi:hypothetical protein
MTSDQDKFIQVGGQLLHQGQNSAEEVVLIIFGVLLATAMLAGAALAVWIFRGGLSRRLTRG